MTLPRGESAFADAGIPMAFVAAGQNQGGLGGILAANGAMASFTGRSEASLAGLAFAELVHRDDLAIGEDQIARLREGEIDGCSFEKRFEHADGHRTWGLLTVAPSQDNGSGEAGALIVQVHDISERKHFVGQLEYFADHDPLTSLCNQRRFRIEVDRQLAYGRRHGAGGAVLMLDLDHFKEINDQFGHAAGDALIIAVATALVANSRETDVIARLGGDEFAILLPEANLNEAAGHAESILKALLAVGVEGAAQGMAIAASCGVAGFLSNDGQSADDVLINADLALYQVKESGRGCVQVYHSDSGLHETVVDAAGGNPGHSQQPGFAARDGAFCQTPPQDHQRAARHPCGQPAVGFDLPFAALSARCRWLRYPAAAVDGSPAWRHRVCRHPGV